MQEETTLNKQILLKSMDVVKKLNFLDQADGVEGGLSILQARMLMVIQNHSPIKMTELAKLLSIKPGSVTPQINRLISGEWLERVTDPNDRRIVRVRLTRPGRRRFQRKLEKKMMGMESALDSITDEEKVSLLNILEKLNGAIDQKLQG